MKPKKKEVDLAMNSIKEQLLLDMYRSLFNTSEIESKLALNIR